VRVAELPNVPILPFAINFHSGFWVLDSSAHCLVLVDGTSIAYHLQSTTSKAMEKYFFTNVLARSLRWGAIL